MIDVYPQLRDTKVEYVWGGTLDFAFDIMPHAGQIDGMYYSLGYAGHGVAMATYLGSKMAEMIGGAREVDNHLQDPVPGRAAWTLQRQALVLAVRRRLVQVSGLGYVTHTRCDVARLFLYWHTICPHFADTAARREM